VLTETAIFHYKQTTEYDRSGQFTIVWNDPEYKLWWPVKQPILSVRDQGEE
jgi:dTDP-4-dehydrorhamnose 3,5-epimerase